MSRLVVVSNRVALPEETRAGGLAVALTAALAEQGGLWFGWSGRIGELAHEVHELEHGGICYATVDLTRAEHAGYYAGFANRVLWPMLHNRPDLIDFDAADYHTYRAVNRRWAEALAQRLHADDVVWVHDYHLIPLAAELRARGCGQRIGFFLHTGLAPAELLRYMPRHRELLATLADYDVVGVQTPRDLTALRDYFRGTLGAHAAQHANMILANGRRVHLDAYPIGIDVDAVRAGALPRRGGTTSLRRLRASLEDRALIIGVDRLDYSKGLPQRLTSFGHLLEQFPQWRRRVSLLQIAPASRGDVPEYRAIRRDLERIAGHINGRYAEPDWTPIRYVSRAFPQSALCGYYRAARVGLVTPLRDGMNLVAMEYLASQDSEDPGVLVLSEFAGAAQQLDAALCVNPLDHEATASAMNQALAMPLDERVARWRDAMHVIAQSDIHHWRKHFLGALRDFSHRR
ncbi:MAG: trehalose-6-phosphate synthase [Metallibacterium scheffleri]|uniref:alpha,alpha-trehalose-phosphate synthase (UDP-forming) n=1 Tax=Metallibacterium scheffleri TaxID=993689 RepID=UPI0026F32A1B|nr:trehalose-6-phosphate synthase [Metallibacterium scheffleri]MCK9367668.1 trehalose-6-phosphate synthase [Metallibacterium scheffleri]